MLTDTTGWVLLLSFSILFSLFSLVAVFWYTWWFTNPKHSLSPFTGLPLRFATEISYYSAEKVVRYLLSYHQYDNRPFLFKKAAFCRETGRIFTDCVTWFGSIKVDWTYLQKRYPGNYVSWGSLNEDQKKAIKEEHETLLGFQTEYSCPEPAPRNIDSEYIYASPGPLYVDLHTKVLLGWKIVPDTELEVLIVQKPSRKHS